MISFKRSFGLANRPIHFSDTLTAQYRYVYDGQGNIVRLLDIPAGIGYTCNKSWNKIIDFISCFFSVGSMIAGFLDFIYGSFDGRCRLW